MEAVRGHFCLLIIRANSRTTPKCLISSFINLHLSSKIYKNFNKWDSLKIINLHRMAGMNKTMLTVSNDKNLKLNFTKNGGLIYKGRIFSKVINTTKRFLHLIPFTYSQLKNQWHHLWTRHFFSRKVTVWTTKLNIVIKNKRYRRTWSWELLFMTRISMIKFEYSKKATKFEKHISNSIWNYLSISSFPAFQLLYIFNQSKCLAVLHFD